MTCRRRGMSSRRRSHVSPLSIIRPLRLKRSANSCAAHYADVLLGNRAYGAWVGSEMVGVAAWSVGEAKSPTARILAVFVHPLFGGDGIGTRLTEYLEDEARAAGYRALETNATLNAIGFFEKLDYLEIRRGVWGLPSGRQMPIAFMRKVNGARPDFMH